MCTKTLSFGLFLLAGLVAMPARAADTPPPRVFETQSVFGAGGPVALPFFHLKQEPTTLKGTIWIAQRFRSPRFTPLAIELNAVLPSGFGANLLVDVFRTEGFRLHVGDIGVHWNAFHPVSCGVVPRPWDFTYGAGADVRVGTATWVTANWRTFMPDPPLMTKKYGDFALPYTDEAMKGGQLWIGFSHAW